MTNSKQTKYQKLDIFVKNNVTFFPSVFGHDNDEYKLIDTNTFNARLKKEPASHESHRGRKKSHAFEEYVRERRLRSRERPYGQLSQEAQNTRSSLLYEQ